MATGLWTAASGALAKTQVIDTTANNLANVDTQGFKKDTPTFKEYLATLEREKSPLDIPRGPIKDKEFYPLDAKDQAFVVTDGTYTHFAQGHLKVTQSPLDVALDGPGFLEISTPQGIRYTRNGSLKISADGRLVTSEGNPVLAAEAQGLANELGQAQPGGQNSVLQRVIGLQDVRGNISISDSGEIYGNGNLIAKLNVVEFVDPRKLRKSGGVMFENKDPQNIAQDTVPKTVVRQGVIETSNVNPVQEMTNLIKANRLFELDMKSMKTHGELLSKEANEIGKL